MDSFREVLHHLSIHLRLGQFLQCLPLTAHQVVAWFGCKIVAPLVEVKLQRWFVPVQNGEVELGATSSQAQLEGGRVKKVAEILKLLQIINKKDQF